MAPQCPRQYGQRRHCIFRELMRGFPEPTLELALCPWRDEGDRMTGRKRGRAGCTERERHTGRGTRGKSEWGDMTYEQPVRTLTRERDLTSDSLLFPQRLCKSSDKLACIALRGFLKRSDILHYVHISRRQNCTNQPVTLTDFSCVLALLHKHIL